MWCFRIVVLEKTLESPLDCKEIKPVNPKWNQPWIFIGRTDAEGKAPILWPPDGKSQLIGKGPDAGNDWSQEEKGALRPWLRQSLRDCSYLWVVNHAAGWMALWKASYPSCLELLNMKAHYNNNDCFDISNCLRWGGHQTSLNEVESLCDAAGTRSARPIGFHRSCPPG